MRNMSFALTTTQVRNRTKTVTRRLGWKFLQPGTLLQPVEKCQGLKKGETVTKIGGPIRVVSVIHEPLYRMGPYHGADECGREGFPEMSPADFIAMFCAHNRCEPSIEVTRIKFEYVEPAEVSC